MIIGHISAVQLIRGLPLTPFPSVCAGYGTPMGTMKHLTRPTWEIHGSSQECCLKTMRRAIGWGFQPAT